MRGVKVTKMQKRKIKDGIGIRIDIKESTRLTQNFLPQMSTISPVEIQMGLRNILHYASHNQD